MGIMLVGGKIVIQSIRIANEMALLEKEARRYCDRKNNRVSLKVPRLALKTNYEGFELSEPKHPFEHLYEKRRERDRTKLDRIHYNKSNYFGPIEERLEQSRDAIHLYSDNKKEEAINLFIKVVEESLSVIKTPQLYFNLGKVLLEEGYSQGIFIWSCMHFMWIMEIGMESLFVNGFLLL